MAFLSSCDTNEKFHLPKGETTIGRGPFLKVEIFQIDFSSFFIVFLSVRILFACQLTADHSS